MIKFFWGLTGSGTDRIIGKLGGWQGKDVMIPAQYYFSKRTMKFTLNPHIPKGVNDIFLDSSGFTLMSKWGDFPFSVEQYAEFLKKKGSLFDYAATMDYPCEPELWITGQKLIDIPVSERIRKTIENTSELSNNYDFQCEIVPVIQGWELKEYLSCIERMHRRDLLTDYVALGSMCTRVDAKKLFVKVVDYLHEKIDCKVHAFGFKITHLKSLAVQQRLYSSDSCAWTHNWGYDRTRPNGTKHIYATTNEEKVRNFLNYEEQINRILNLFNGQQTLLTTKTQNTIQDVIEKVEETS